MIIAFEGYQQVEYLIPKKTFEHAGFKVITASNKPGMATAKDKSQTKVDSSIEDAVAADYVAVVVVGGPGAMDNLDNQITYQLLTQAFDLQILIGAICIAPRILAHATILTDIAATGWDDDNNLKALYDEYGVVYIEAPVVHDENIITATGPHAAQQFADTIVATLKSKK